MNPTSTDRRRPDNGSTRQARDAAVQKFLGDFARALSAGDGKTIATMWEVPALVTSDAGLKAVASRQEVEQFFSGAKEQYSARGIEEAIPQIQAVDWVTERIAITRVRWPYVDRSGREIGEESSTYTLRRDDDGALKLCAVVMHGEKQR
jgi:hypothetical protein